LDFLCVLSASAVNHAEVEALTIFSPRDPEPVSVSLFYTFPISASAKIIFAHQQFAVG
jgi:hypothetical protein